MPWLESVYIIKTKKSKVSNISLMTLKKYIVFY
jgi:hypothetical protein